MAATVPVFRITFFNFFFIILLLDNFFNFTYKCNLVLKLTELLIYKVLKKNYIDF